MKKNNRKWLIAGIIMLVIVVIVCKTTIHGIKEQVRYSSSGTQLFDRLGSLFGTAGDETLLNKELIVGTDIAFDAVTDFYYTEENINYDAFYQRYRFYVQDGKHMFFHETRERKDDYGPCTEKDTTQTGTTELSDDQWSQFCGLVSGGIVKAREESDESGGTGPWLYMYWTNDESKYQQFSFDSYSTEIKFEQYCLSLK